MKSLQSKLSLKIEDSTDEKRTFEISKTETGWISVGTGHNTKYPQFDIHPHDIEKFIESIRAVVSAKLPGDL